MRLSQLRLKYMLHRPVEIAAISGPSGHHEPWFEFDELRELR